MAFVPFAEYRPDVAGVNGAYSDNVVNVLPADGSYIPVQMLEPLTEALGAAPLAAFFCFDTTGGTHFFAGSAGALWKLDTTDYTWDDVSQAMTTYGATAEDPWDFAQFGDYVIAVNPNDDPQVFDLTGGTAFADLAGSPPRARYVRIWGDFVALLNLTSYPNRVHWSALNDHTGWTPGTNNSDYQEFPDGGVVQGSSSGTNPIIFLERAIHKGQFVPGSIEVFTFRKIHDLRGAKAPRSIASRGALCFFADEGGFFQIDAEGGLAAIGFEKVDRTIFTLVGGDEVANIRAVVDPVFNRVYFAVKLSPSAPNFDTLLVYDWGLQRWAMIEANILLHFPAATPGFTLEGLDTISPSLDDLPLSLDSKAWRGGAQLLGAFSPDNALGFFSGANAAARIITQEMGEPARVTLVRSFTPIIDTDQVYGSIGARHRLSDTPVYTGEQVPSSNTGVIRKKSRARYNRIAIRIAEGATWNLAQGVEIDTQAAGER